MKESCRVCGEELRGNRRRWIFGKTGRVDLQAILSHVLGRAVGRDGRGEFLCGRCVFVLESVYRYDTVLARVQALSIEKVQRLLSERDGLCGGLRRSYLRRHPLEAEPHSAAGQQVTADVAQLPHERYNLLLQGDMALSEFECWSERSERVPVTRHCPCRHPQCHSCHALRVSDSDYESVCKVPRRLAGPRSPTSLPLSRDKSQSMPLDWLYSPNRSRGHSASSSSHGGRTRSEDGVFEEEGQDEGGGEWDSWSPIAPERSLSTLSRSLSAIASRPRRPVPGSRIPIRLPSEASSPRESRTPTPRLQPPTADHSEDLEGLRDQMADRYLPLNTEKFLSKEKRFEELEMRVEQLSGSLELTRTQNRARDSEQEPPPREPGSERRVRARLVRELLNKEQLLQLCVQVMTRVTRGDRSTEDMTDDLVETLRDRLKERDAALERAADDKFSFLEEKEAETKGLRAALRDLERDVGRLSLVLTHNQQMINLLNQTLTQKASVLSQTETLCKTVAQTAREVDGSRTAALREKDTIIARLQEAMESRGKDVSALTDSVLGRGLSGGPDVSASLCASLKDKESLLSRCLEEQRQASSQHQAQVDELLNTITHKERSIQELTELYSQTQATREQAELSLTQRLADKEQEMEVRARAETITAQERETKRAELQTLLEEKDQTILDLLEASQEKDRLLARLQDQLQDSTRLKLTMKQAL